MCTVHKGSLCKKKCNDVVLCDTGILFECSEVLSHLSVKLLWPYFDSYITSIKRSMCKRLYTISLTAKAQGFKVGYVSQCESQKDEKGA